MLKVEHSINYLNKKKADSEILGEIQYVKQLNSQIRSKRSDDSLKLPGNFKVGQAIGGGDCFFDSVAQGLKRLKPEMNFTVKSLREACKKFAQSQLENDQSWLKEALKNENEQINEYIPRIEFAANDIEQKSRLINVFGLTSPIWGRSEIEGRIICKEYNVKLHIIEKHVVVEEVDKELWIHQIVNSEGSRSVGSMDYNEGNTIHIINRGNAHFEPILSTQEIQCNKQQSSNHDTPEEGLKISAEEQPEKQERPNEENELEDIGKKSQESEQQLPDFSSDRVKRTNNDPNAGSSQNDQGNTDLHKYASSGSLENFKDSFEKLKKDNLDNYLKIVSKRNHYDETALSLAIENKNFNIAIWLLNQLTDEQINDQLDILDSVDSEKFDKLLDHAKTQENKKIINPLSHKASELKLNRHGKDYQSKLLMLFAYETYSYDIQFRLGTEVHKANKFDDLVLRYHDSGVIKYRFLPAKHKQFLGEENKIKVSELRSDIDKKDFSLQKYFVSYLKNKEAFRDVVPEDFIICTNTDFDFEPKETERQGAKDDKTRWKGYLEKTGDDKVLNLGGEIYHFKKYLSIRAKIILELKPIFQRSLEKNGLSDGGIDEKIGDFLDKLVFAVKQPSSILLSEKIRERMGSNTYKFIYFATFKEYIDEWFASRQSDNTARFILSAEIKEFFNGLKNKIANIELNGLSSLSRRKIEKFIQRGLEFNDNNSRDVNNVKSFLSSGRDRILKLRYKEKDSFLSIAKVYQILKKEYQDISEYTVSDLYSLSSLNFDDSHQERVVNALKSKNKRLLVIECNFIDEDGKRLISKLYREVLAKYGSNKKVILVLNEKLNDQLSKILSDLSSTPVDMENNLNSFIPGSKNTILETEITLFGKPKQLNSLTTGPIKDDLYSAIDGDALTTLINSDSNVIGSKHKYDFDTYIDIPRTLTYQTKIDKKCLEENKNDLFAISGIEKSDFSQLVPKKEKRREFVDKDSNEKGPIRFIRLDNHRDIKKEFDELCRDYKERTIHLLENKDSVLEWKQSHGSLFNLRRFVLKTKGKEKQINDLTDSAIIAAEAGMGKSTILTTYSMSKDFLWPIRINLKDYQTDINNANFDDLSGIVEFLSNIIDPASSKTSLIKNLLQYCLTQQGQVTLLLDGYDEIKDRSQEKVVQLLRTLRTTQGKVLITTRSHVRSELEDALGIFAFDKKQQKEFLKNFWIERLNVKEPTQEKKIDEFTKQLLNYFHKLNLMKKEGLVRVALQARMVAEIFQDKCKEYLKHEQFNSHNFGISNISDLYERFVEYQYERYLKGKIEISAKLSVGSRTSLTSSYTKAYGDLALKSLFSEDQIQGLLSKEIFLREELQDIGLVKILKNDGTADFIHPTYGEYFVADFLVNALGKEKGHPKYRAVHNLYLQGVGHCS